MKILDFCNNEGDISCRVYISMEEIDQAGNPQLAVNSAIADIAGEKGLGTLLYPRVTAMDWDNDMNLIFSFDAAVKPVLSVEDFTGLEVYVPAGEDKEAVIMEAVSDKLIGRIPETVISRRLDALIMQRKAEVADKSKYTTISDIYAILKAANEKLCAGMDDDKLWFNAVELGREFNGQRGAEGSADDLIEAVAQALIPEGADEKQLADVDECLEKRMSERSYDSAESLVNQCFECYLRLEGITMEETVKELRADAVLDVRVDMLADAVAEQQGFEVTDDELELTLKNIGDMYELDRESVLEMVSMDAIVYKIRRDKAREYITGKVKVI